MAKAEVLFKMIRKWEGGWSDHKNDKGGKTEHGNNLVKCSWKLCGYDKRIITVMVTFDAENDLRMITPDDVFHVFKKYYWDRYQADFIHNQSIANICVDLGMGFRTFRYHKSTTTPANQGGRHCRSSDCCQYQPGQSTPAV